ncbi:Alpha/Beta hydrolase protein [Schizophyllum amplum]|uniref:Alpha/Beta hydrolase protein n=1 Tax=Schizophyllum amplum TaxID=97359 RepID=A0A550C149_9AGAR|nr:Alpha/Beta hydrolase protein [Auriculariopsis ampla]
MDNSAGGWLPAVETFAKGTFATAAALGTVGMGLLYYGQNYLIYPSAFPSGSREEVAVPTDYNLDYDSLELQTPDGVTLRCYLLVQHKDLGVTKVGATHIDEDVDPDLTDNEFIASRPTVIMFHGNGGNHGHRIPLARVFYLKMRCNVLMMSYRGYGLSDGSPSEKGFVVDAQTALDYLLSDPLLSQTSIILYGQSIGGAVSIDLASKNPDKIAALVLENTFMSMRSLIPSAMPLLGPVSFLCHQRWDSASKIPRIPASVPILMLSGAQDELVPPEHMRSLFELVVARKGDKMDNEKVKFAEFPHGGHNDTCAQPGYWSVVADFIAGLGDRTAAKAKKAADAGGSML